jgi:hypothetical protein
MATLGPGNRAGSALFLVEANLDAFQSALDRFLVNFQGNVQEVLRAHGEDFEAAAKQKAPVDTGRFRNSIHTVLPGTAADAYQYSDDQGNSFDGGLTGIPTGPNVVTVGTRTKYAIYLEAGHSRQAPQGVFGITLLEKRDALREGLIDAAFDAMMED